MSFQDKTNNDPSTVRQAISALPESIKWLEQRKQQYPEASDEDIGMIYDMLTTIVTYLSVPIGLKERQVLNHRQRIKKRFPKP